MAAKGGGFGDKLLYLLVRGACGAVRKLPHGTLIVFARFAGTVMNLVPQFRTLARANIHAALPELPPREVHRIAKESFYHLVLNLTEFFWLNGDEERIRRWYCVREDVVPSFRRHQEKNERLIFVNPHMGSWEASGVVGPFYTGISMVAIAKPMRNPYLNELLNHGGREKTRGVRIIFAHGAIRAAAKALRDGLCVGTLVDQNTRLRDGGVWVNFFGLPVAGSPAPAVLNEYCRSRGIPAVIVYTTCVRTPDGRITGHIRYLSRPFEEYRNAEEVMQELMHITESFIRQYPEQYLWMYKRFRYIGPGVTPEQRARYPRYAEVPNAHFYGKRGDVPKG